ncbi:hypothetical protein LTR85_004675 [Meristemomyces frigidus]|nr:hypothetical protein LTR85_004675 [Meristemomyces frigidus]
MYSASWACGGNLFVYAEPATGEWPAEPSYPIADYGADGSCGIKSYSSLDPTNWSLENNYQPSESVANVTKPLVRCSTETGLYVMIMRGAALKGFWYATSASPGGPWSDPPFLIGGSTINHDFDVMVSPNGTHYILTDPFTGDYEAEPIPTWDVWVCQLAPNLKSILNTTATSSKIRTAESLQAQGLYLEAASAFYQDGFYYALFGMTCQNCAGYIYGLFAEHPLDHGGTVVVSQILGYRTSPTDYVISKHSYKQEVIPINNYIWHADNNVAASSTYWYPLTFNHDHTIKNLTCAAEVRIPLVGKVELPAPPAPYQLDCRIRTWRKFEATYAVPKHGATIEMRVWQRTDNLGPTTNAGPVLDGNLNVTLTYADGSVGSFSWVPGNISWTPAKISMDVQGKDISKMTLSTNATNGCYGTLVQPKVDGRSQYGAVVPGLGGKYQVQEKSELYVYRW